MKNSGSMTSALLAISFAGAGASVSGMQGLYAHNYIVTDAGVEYSVMDVFVKFNSNVGTGSNGERIVNFYGQETTDSTTGGVNKKSKFENNLGLAFQHSNTSWLPAAGANGGTGNNTWDSFVTVGARTQGAGNTAGVNAGPWFSNPNSNVGSIMSDPYRTMDCGADWSQSNPVDPGFETNTSAYPDHMIMLGRFSLKSSAIAASGILPTMKVWVDLTGKSTAQTGGTTLYTMASINLKSDAQTQYTTSGKTWTFDSSFDGVPDSGQAAWTFSSGSYDLVPVPSVAALLGMASLLKRRRR